MEIVDALSDGPVRPRFYSLTRRWLPNLLVPVGMLIFIIGITLAYLPMQVILGWLLAASGIAVMAMGLYLFWKWPESRKKPRRPLEMAHDRRRLLRLG